MEKQNYNINELEQIKNNQSEQIEENQSEQIEYCKVCGKPITKCFNFWDKKSRLVRCRCDYDLLILDDIGTERNTDYSLENVY